jgi:AAHS family 3-hydroxyphenylpropionic acid transporter
MVGGEKGGRAATGLVLALCMAAALLEGFDNQTIGAVAPRLVHAFHLKPTSIGWMTPLGWVLTASTLGLLIGAAIGGRLADRFGFRRVLVSTIALMGLASCATVFAYDAPTLFAARFLTGLGLGGSLPNVLALVSGSVAQTRRGAAVAAVYAGLPFGGAIAAVVTLFGPADEWRTVFLIGGLIPLTLAPALLLLPDRAAHGAEQGSARESGRESGRPITPVTEVLFGGGRALATVLLWGSFVLTLLILYLLLNWLPTLTASRGYGRDTVALVQTAFNLGGALACLAAGSLLDGARRKGFVVAVYGLLGLSIAGLATLNAGPALEIALGGVLGAAVLLAQTVLYDAAPRLYPAAMRGTGVGWAVALGRIGSVAGPLLGGVLVAHGSTPAQVLMRLTPVVARAGVGTLLHEWRARPARVRASVASAA